MTELNPDTADLPLAGIRVFWSVFGCILAAVLVVVWRQRFMDLA